MEIGKTLDVKDREEWRLWLSKNYDKEKEIWLIYYRKSSGKKRIPYKDCVEEALCYGWIDGIVKGIDEEKFCQRFSPRRPNSNLSEMNKENIRRMIKAGKMTPVGLKAVSKSFNHEEDKKKKLVIAPDILKAIKSNKEAWANFQKLSDGYKKIRIAYIEHYRGYNLDNSKDKDKIFKQKLAYFLKMTAKGKTYGLIRD
jgi:uncharacterized protein YdeI (YjbR/CyaY-like superfamily)